MSPKRRDTRVAFYTETETRDQLEREAERADQSLSQYVYDLVQQARSEDTFDQKMRELSAEERIEALFQDTKDITASAGAYPIVNFYVLKRLFREVDDLDELPEPWINDQFVKAAEKLGSPIEDHDPAGDDPPADDRSGAYADENNTTTLEELREDT